MFRFIVDTITSDSYGDGGTNEILTVNLHEAGYQGSDYTCQYDPLGCLDISCDGGSWK